MGQVKVVEGGRLQDKDGYWALCSYDDSKNRIKVIVSGQAANLLMKFPNVELTTIYEDAVLFALQKGQCNGEVLVAAESPAERHLKVIYKTSPRIVPDRVINLWLNNSPWQVRRTPNGYEYRSNPSEEWQLGIPPGSAELDISVTFAKLSS
jgi:hypothetical protein